MTDRPARSHHEGGRGGFVALHRYGLPMTDDHRPLMLKEVREKLDDLRPFTTLIIAGIALSLIGSAIVLFMFMNPSTTTSYGTPSDTVTYSLPGLLLGAVVGIVGTVLLLRGLARALNALHDHFALARYRTR